jgi:hypothetical protein
MFQGGAVRPNGAVGISVRYEQWDTTKSPAVKIAEFVEPIEYAPDAVITQPIVRAVAMARVALLNGREGVANAIDGLRETDISGWPQV